MFESAHSTGDYIRFVVVMITLKKKCLRNCIKLSLGSMLIWKNVS